MNDQLKTIDFSKGIKSEEIQHNFNVVKNQLARERLAVAGHGISSGMEFSVDGFVLTITAGSLIDIDGNEVFFDETKIAIQLPRITTQRDETLTVQVGGQVILDNIPYATTRLMPSQYAPATQYGITVVDYSNTSKTLSVLTIDNKTLAIDARWDGKLVKVTYGYTNKRYDTVYIDTDYTIRVMEGITSSSPSVPMPTSYKYILGFVEVNPFASGTSGSKVAKMSIKKDMKHLRNVFTDENNVLYICGTPFEDLQIVHMIEPETPIENQLWYDSVSNKLKVRKTIDGIAQWVNVNDTSIIPVQEYKIWTPLQNPADRQTFLFHYTDDLNMRYVPNRNALDIIIDQTPLHSDQFEELTLADAVANPGLHQKLVSEYGYTAEFIDEMNQSYENIGIGFRLGSVLDKTCYVEAKAVHRVNENPIMYRFQRTATFVGTDSFVYNSNMGKEFTTNAPFRIGENQLEVFVEGKRLDPKTEFLEGSDLSGAARVDGTASRKFKLLKDVASGSVLAYKITATVFSYDHVEKILGDIEDKAVQAELISTQVAEQVQEFVQDTNSAITSLSSSVQEIQTVLQEHSQFVKKTDVLSMSNMPAAVTQWIPKGIINMSLTKNGTMNLVSGIHPEDFIVMFDMQGSAGNSILRRGADYDITQDATSGNVYVNFIDPNAVTNGHTLYIIGLKFK